MSYFLAFLGFALLIILHEAGHFGAAKAVGMRVERFSLFFGPLVFRRRRGETEYGVGVIPLGGYVKITGMTSGEVFETPEIEARAYCNQPVWRRIVVIAAGPAVNVLIAFVIVWALAFFSWGHQVPSDVVAAVVPHSAAAGVLRPGDKLVAVDGMHGSPDRLRAAIERHRCAGPQVNGCSAQTPARLVISRDGVLHTYEVRPRYDASEGATIVGFDFLYPRVNSSITYAAGQSAAGMWNVTKVTVSTVARIFEPQERRQIHSVLGAYKVTQEDIASSATKAWEIIALISLSLGVINLFPFLPLDGGHIFWALVEKLRGRRVPFVVMERAGIIGIALVLGLFLIGLSNDVSGLANGSLNVH